MGIGSLGFSEMLVIAVLVLIFFGPRRMPEIGRTVGGALREFRRGLNEIQRELQEAERAASVEPDKSASKGSPASSSPLAAALGTAQVTPEAAEPEGEKTIGDEDEASDREEETEGARSPPEAAKTSEVVD